MKITFLGTGTSQGVPVVACPCDVCLSDDIRDKRTRTSVLLELGDSNVVVDTGPDFRAQMLKANVKHLEAVLFTHAHKDHTAGLDDIRPFNFMQNMDMPIYAESEVINVLKREFAYAFAENKYPGVPRFEINELDGQPFKLFNDDVTPIRVMHYKLPVLGFRIRNFTYITDANEIEEKEIEKIKGTKILVLNALRKEKHYSHFNLEEAIEMSVKCGAEHTYFTHISHLMGKHADIKLPDNCSIAYDGLVVEV